MGVHEKSFDINHVLYRETTLVALLKGQLVVTGDEDEESLASAIESQTNLNEVLAQCVIRDAELKAEAAMLADLILLYTKRKSANELRQKHLKAAMDTALEQMEVKTLKTPFGTISRKLNPAKIEIENEKEVATKYWVKPTPVPLPQAVIDNASLKADAVARFIERQAEITRIKALFAQPLADANAIQDDAERGDALVKIEDEFAYQMWDLDQRLPAIAGVKVAEPTYSIQIRRA